MSAAAKPEAKRGAAVPVDEAKRIGAERGWQHKGPATGGYFSWETRPCVLRSPLSVNIPPSHHLLNVSQVLANIGENMPGLSSIIR